MLRTMYSHFTSASTSVARDGVLSFVCLYAAHAYFWRLLLGDLWHELVINSLEFAGQSELLLRAADAAPSIARLQYPTNSHRSSRLVTEPFAKLYRAIRKALQSHPQSSTEPSVNRLKPEFTSCKQLRSAQADAKQADARPDTNVCQIGCPGRLMTARER